MATWEDILGASTRTNATRPTATTPAVIRRSDVMNQGVPISVAGGYAATPTDVQKRQAEQPGGFMGFLTDVMESPLGRVVGKAGEVISIPGRVVTSFVQEAKDKLDGNPNTQASWNDFTKQVADPTFGFGRVIGDLTGSSFVNRVLGFAGDVLLDPLTYVTFGGNKVLKEVDELGNLVKMDKAFRVSSKAGREALAARVLEKTGNAELAKEVYRYGRSAMSGYGDEIYQAIGLDRAGVYFMGRRVGGTKIGEAAENVLAKARTWSGDTIFRRVSENFTPTDVRAARVALARGKATTEKAEKFIRLIISENEKKAAVGAALRDGREALTKLVDDIGEAEFKAATPTVHKILEGTVPAIDEAAGIPITAEQRTAQKIASWFSDRWAEVDNAARAVDPAHEAFPIKNYFPHMLSEDGIRFITTSNTDKARKLRELILNPLNDSGAFKHRMQYGDEFFGTVLKEDLGPLTVDNLNRIARNAGFDGDFFETNAAVVLDKYVNQYAEQMGQIARRKYLVDNNVFKELTEKVKVDSKAVARSAKMVDDALSGSSKSAVQAGEKVRSLVEVIRKNAAIRAQRATNEVTDLESLVAGAMGRAEMSSLDVYEAANVLEEAMSEMMTFSSSLSSLYDDVPDVIRAMEAEYDSVINDIASAKTALATNESTVEAMQLRLEEIATRTQEIADRRMQIADAGVFVQQNIDKIMSGKSFSGEGFVEELANALSKAVKLDTSVKGTRELSMRSVVESDWWKAANPGGDISITKLRNLKAAEVAELASASLRGEASIEEMRQAILWVASANPNIRSSQPELWDRLFGPDGVMVKAAKSDQYHKLISATRDSQRNFARINERATNLMAGERMVRTAIGDYVSSQRMLREMFGESGALGINEAMFRADPIGSLRQLLAKPEYESLEPYFHTLINPVEGVGVTGIPKDLGFDDIVKIVKGIGDDFASGKEISFSVSYKTTGKFGAEKIEQKLVVNVSDMLDDVNWLIANGSTDDVDNFIELVISGRRGDGVISTAQKNAGGPKVNRRGRLLNPAERIADDTGKGGVERLKQRLGEAERTADAREQAAKAALLGGDTETATIQMAKRQADLFDAKAIKETITELMSREAASNSIRGQMRALELEMKKFFPNIPTSYFGSYMSRTGKAIGGTPDVARVIYEDAMMDLQDGLSKLWFANDVESRVARATEALASQGLVADVDLARRIYNKVASEHLELIRRDVSSVNETVYKMSRIMGDIRSGAITSSEEAYRAIDDLLSNSDVSRAVARAKAGADAPRLLGKWNFFGGKTGQTGAYMERKALDPIVARAGREEYIEELRDWYQAVFPNAKRNTPLGTIKETLDSMKAANPVVRRRVNGQWVTVEAFGPSSTLEDLGAWLNDTIRQIDSGSRYIRRSERWLRVAADPFIDINNAPTALLGKSQWGMDLPGVVSRALHGQAQKMLDESQKAATLASRASEAAALVAEKQGEIDALDLLRQALETPRGTRAKMPLTQAEREGVGLAELRETQKIVRQIIELKSNPNYLSAVERQELNDVINLLADISSDGPIRIPQFETHVSSARKMFDAGTPLYIKKNNEWLPVTSRGQIDDSLKFGDIGYQAINNDAVKNGVGRSTKNIKNKQAINNVYKRIDELEKQLERGSISTKKYESEMRKVLKDSEKLAGRDNEVLGYSIQPVMGDAESIAEYQKHVRSLMKERDGLKASLEKSYSTLDQDAYLKKQAEVKVRLNKIEDELTKLRSARPTGTKARRFVSKDGVEIVFSPEEMEALFLSGADMANVNRLVAEGKGYDNYLIKLEQERAMGRIGSATKRMIQERRSIITDDELEILARLSQDPRSLIEGAELSPAAMRAIERKLMPMWDDEIKRLSHYRNRINLLAKASDPQLQQSALLKAHYILQSIKNGELTMEELRNGISKLTENSTNSTTKWNAAARRGHLDRVWQASEDGKLLNKISELESSGQYAIYRGVLKDLEKSKTIANRLRIEADRLATRAYDASLEGTSATTKFINSLQAISDRVGNGYDAVAQYHLYTTRRSGRLSPAKAVERIRAEVAKFQPSEVAIKGVDEVALAEELTRLSDEAAYLVNQVKPNVDLVTGKITPGLELNIRQRAVAALEERGDALGKSLEANKKVWAKEKKQAIKTVESEGKKIGKRLKKAEKTWIDATAKFDEDRLLALESRQYAEMMFPKLDAERATYVDFLDNVTKLASREEVDMGYVAEVMNWLDEWDQFADEVVSKVNPNDLELIHKLRADALSLQSEILSAQNSPYLQRIQAALESGELGKEIKRKVDKRMRFVSMKEYGLPSYQAEEWLADAIKNMGRIQVPEFARGLSKYIGRYTGFFKAYAVSTPGFVGRNALSNTFTMVAAGADLKYMNAGARLYADFAKAVKAGTIKEWMSKQTPEVLTAVRAMDASGYGRGTEALRLFNPKRKWLVDNRYVNFFRTKNEWFEGSARFTLAYDTVMKGGDFNAATARVKRYLFDYSTATPADDVMRSIIPFWFWMSRNMPMSIINQYENPRAYLMYGKLMNAISQDEEGDIVPSWIKESGGVKIADGLYLNPDLGFNTVGKQLQEMTDPVRLLSYVNPGLRVPIETVIADKKFYRDMPFSDKPQQAAGGPLSPAVAALASLFGQDKQLPTGERGVTDRFNYGLTNLLPPLAQLGRLAPSDTYNKEKRNSNWASYFGIPVREVTQAQIEAELRRRAREGG